MNKLRSLAIGSIGLLALAGCSASEPAPEEEKPATQAPTLSVPDVTEEGSVTVRVNTGSVETGETIHVSAFGGGFDTKTPSCNQEADGADMKVSGPGQEQDVTVQLPEAGYYQMSLSAPGYTSDCASESARTTAKTNPNIFLDGNLEADGETTYEKVRGKPFDATVILTDGVPKKRPLPVDVTVLGPFSTEPELRASQCSPEKAISNQKLQWSGKEKSGTGTPHSTAKVTIDDVPGLYLVTAKLNETEQNFAAETSCDNYQSVMKVAVENK